MNKENSTNNLNNTFLQKFCNAHKTLSQITGRWKISIIVSLKDKQLPYSDFKNILPTVTDRILSKQLDELKKDGIILNDKNKTQSIYYLSIKGKEMVKLVEYINQLKLI